MKLILSNIPRATITLFILKFISFIGFFIFSSGSIAAGTNTIKEFDGHAYEVIKTAMTWEDSREYAIQKSGTLVKINSFQENVFVKLLMSEITSTAQDGGGARYFWLGGSDKDFEGDWKWIDETKIDTSIITARSLWGQGPGFENGSSEPDNFMGNQDCLAMGLETWPKGADNSISLGSSGQWNDISCSNKLGFVIEYDISASFKDGLLEVKHLTAGDKKYWASFQITECNSICLKLVAAKETKLPTTGMANYFSENFLKIKKLEYADKIYELDLNLIDSENLIFEATKASLTSSIQTFPSDSWISVTPEDAGMDSAELQKAIDYAFENVIIDGKSMPQNTQGLVVIRHGAIVAERYAQDSDKESIATSWSTAKSFTSALIGIAVDRGYISSIETSAAEFIPEWKNDETKNITIKNLLMMSSGLKEKGSNDGAIMYSGEEREDGSIDYSKPVNNTLYSIQERVADASRAHWLGATYNWNYQNTDPQILGEIIERTTGKTLYDFAETELFSKIGMKASWWKDAFNNYMAWCCIDATTRAFARFGLLYAREGKWGGETVVPAEWAVESTEPNIVTAPSLPTGYSYLWWPHRSGEWFIALGSRSNNIYVHPGLDLVVVRNSTLELVGNTKERSTSYHLTEFPAQWDHEDFFQPIIDSAKP